MTLRDRVTCIGKVGEGNRALLVDEPYDLTRNLLAANSSQFADVGD